MYLLEHVEQRLSRLIHGLHILYDIYFVDFPSPPVIRSLSTCFYGNNVPVYTASQLYMACNDTCNIHATNYMYQLYLGWQNVFMDFICLSIIMC
jgi:hypothetical protein